MKAERAQQGRAPSGTLPLAAPHTPAQAQPVALNTATNCNLKPGVCARLRNQAAARGNPPAPVLAYAGTSERCTTKPMVCARLKSGPGQRPITMASEPGPSALE